MAQRVARISASEGLHARPASLFVKAVQATGLDVMVAKEGKDPADAGSILEVLSLGVKQGDTVTLSVEGEGADAALDDLVKLLENQE